MRRPLLSFLLLLGLLRSDALRAAESAILRVQAGDFTRRDTLISFSLPSGWPQNVVLRRDKTILPIQVLPDGRAFFVLDALAKSRLERYELEASSGGPRPAAPQIQTRRDGSKIQFDSPRPADNKALPLLEFQAEPGDLPRPEINAFYRRGAYLHPIRTLTGRVVTDDFPPNHIHHHGVWWAWTHTVFDAREPDFWNMGEGKGRVDLVSVDAPWSGPVLGGFRSRQRFVDLTAKEPATVLLESWEVTMPRLAGRTARGWTFDLLSEQECATRQELRLPEYRYGGIGIRGNRAWDGAGNTFFLTSEGETDRVKAQGTRGRWCDMSGEVDGARAGIAILCHPDNFRAPQPMRVHPTEPFFNFAPQEAGDMTIEPGHVYRSRYRFVVHDGPPDRAELDRLWNDFAHPPAVDVTVAGR